MAKFRTASGLVDVTPMLRTASGLVQADALLRDAGGLIEVGEPAEALAISLSPPDAYGANNSAQKVTTSSITASATGGAGGYVFVWAGMTDFDVLSPSSAATAFRTKSNMANGATVSDVATCTVTDSSGATASVNASVTADNYGYYDNAYL